MHVKFYEDATACLTEVRDFLLREEAVNNVPLGMLASRSLTRPAAFHAAVIGPAGVEAVALITPPYNLLISGASAEAAAALAPQLHAAGYVLPGVNGPAEAASGFAQAWIMLTGGRFTVAMEQMIYRLTSVAIPRTSPGVMREMTSQDVALVAAWIKAFITEAEGQSREDPTAAAKSFLNSDGRRMFLWEDDEPVSMAAAMGPTPNGIRIGAVYTPPELRGRGYASNCVAAVSQMMLDEGKSFVFLYTDAANSTSNNIYRRIGYQFVADAASISFSRA